MIKYRKVCEFNYKNKPYVMYLDNHNRHFFLENKQGSLAYISLKELVELAIQFNSDLPVMCAKEEKDEKCFLPRVLISGVTTLLTLNLIRAEMGVFKKKFSEQGTCEKQIEDYISYDDSTLYVNEKVLDDEVEDLVVDTYWNSDKEINIYDMEYLDKVLEKCKITKQQLMKVIKENKDLRDDFKKIVEEYCEAVIKKYPDIELRILHHNLKKLKIKETGKGELVKKTLDFKTYACFNMDTDEITILKHDNYDKGTWAYQVLFHELSHCLRMGRLEIDDKKVIVQDRGLNLRNTIVAEALNSLFAASLLGDEEKMPYQLQSNYLKIMIDCMDNYALDDYIEHSLSYLAKKLDEFNGDNNVATVILELIEVQYKDYCEDKIQVNEKEYYPLYDYIAKMYYQKYITADMTYADALEVANQLVEKIVDGVSSDYNIDILHFNEYVQQYFENTNEVDSEDNQTSIKLGDDFIYVSAG